MKLQDHRPVPHGGQTFRGQDHFARATARGAERMLTRIYRIGPSPQQILKGFAVVREGRESLADALAGRVYGTCRAVRPNFGPHWLWLDTGKRWLHTPAARAAAMRDLAEAVVQLNGEVVSAGGVLIPGGMLAQHRGRYVGPCEDRHALSTITPEETAVACNLFRRHVPLLLALTGRGAVGRNITYTTGSLRMATSGNIRSSHYLESVSPKHIARVRQALEREDGVPSLDSLEVYPIVGERESTVVLRITDSQTLLATTFAHAILYQALLLQARRLARAGRAAEDIPQRLLERNRSRAMVEGLNTTLLIQPRNGRENGSPRNRGQPPGRDVLRSVPAREAILSLMEDLRTELQVLEVTYAEIASVVLGPTLRALRVRGLQNENDLARVWRAGSPKARIDETQQYQQRLYETEQLMADELTTANEHAYPRLAEQAKAAWTRLLAVRPNTLRAAPRHPGDGASGEVPPSRTPSRGSHCAPPQVGAAHRGAGRFVRETVEMARMFVGRRPSPSDVAAGIGWFVRQTGCYDLVEARRSLSGDESTRLVEALRSITAGGPITVDNLLTQGADGPAARSFLERVRADGGAAVGRARVVYADERRLVEQMRRFTKSLPPEFALLSLDAQEDRSVGQLTLDFLLARLEPEGAS